MIRREDGMTLIEVMVATIVICVAIIATLGTYAHFSSATSTARQRALLTTVAQREIEQLKPVAYEHLGLAGSVPTQAGTDAPLTGTAASEPVVNGGVVNPGGDSFVYQGAHGRIYRYVTARALSCAGLTATVQNQLSTLFGTVASTVQASVPDLCTGTEQTKRITVVVVPTDDNGVATSSGVRLSTIKRDPRGFVPTVTNATLALQQATTATIDAGTGAEALATQNLILTDTRCTSPARVPPADHDTSDTSQAGFTCAPSGPAPTLMTPASLGGSISDPVNDFSTDVSRAAEGGLALLRDTQSGSCTSSDNLVYQNPETDQRKHAIHTWASVVPTSGVETPASGGRATLSLWSSTADATKGPARLCVTLRRGSNGVVIGHSDFSLASWPSTPTELVTAFDLDHADLAPGERLLLTLRVPADSGHDIRILYDHPKYASSLSYTTLQSGGGE